MKLTNKQIRLMECIHDGVDILGYWEAVECRKLEKLGLVIIGEIQGDYKVDEQRPYFGAILSAKGKAALKEAIK